MPFMITHGHGVAVGRIPRRSAASALRAVNDLRECEATNIVIEDPQGRFLTVEELADWVGENELAS
jgi:hypothetical protein